MHQTSIPRAQANTATSQIYNVSLNIHIYVKQSS